MDAVDSGGPIRVLVVGPRHPGARSRGGMATVVGLMREHRDPRVRVTTIATYVDAGPARRTVMAAVGLTRATGLVLTRRVDVLHVHLAHRGSVVRKSLPLLAARWRGVPAVIHAHSYDFAGWFDALTPRGRDAVRRALPATRWLVLGEGLVAPYRDRLRLDRAAIAPLHNPAPPVRPVAPPVPAGGVVLAVALGRMGVRKGTHDLLAALVGVDDATRARLRVVLAGDGEVDHVRAEVARLGLIDMVEVRGWIAPPERDALLGDADLLVLPSHAEGLPMAMLEAMAAGLVPVVTDVGTVAEVAHHDVNAVLVPAGEPAVLGEALSALVADDDRRARLGAAARRTAASMSVDAWFDRLVETWRQAVDPTVSAGAAPSPPPR